MANDRDDIFEGYDEYRDVSGFDEAIEVNEGEDFGDGDSDFDFEAAQAEFEAWDRIEEEQRLRQEAQEEELQRFESAPLRHHRKRR